MGEFGTNLKRFSDMKDVQVAKDDPDVRGWDVVSQDGGDIGEVKDLLVDPSAMKVRALEVELDKKRFNIKDNRHVAIPVERVQINDDKNDVVVNGLGYDEIGRMPVYTGYTPAGPESARRPTGEFDRERMRGSSEDEYAARGEGEFARGEERESLTRSEEELAVGKRREQEGEVRVGKHIETDHVSRDVPLEHERVRVERRPATEQTAGKADMREDEIRVPVYGEEAVVEKRPVVKEEVVISKERTSQPERVDADLKKERLDIDKDGDVLDESGRDRGER